MEIQSQGCIRSYSFRGNDLSRIVFYGHGVEHQEVNRGWLDYTKDDGQSTDIVSIDIEEPVKAAKVNLHRTDNYYLKDHKARCFRNEKQYVLYIYAAPVETRKVFRYETDLKADYVECCLYRIGGTLQYPLRREGHEPQSKVDSIWVHKTWISEAKPFDAEVKALAKEIKERTKFEENHCQGLDVKEDDLAILLKHYDITPRKSPRVDPDRKGPTE